MRISSTRNPNLFYVDWWLMNHNSRKASYEHELLHCGNIDLPYLKDCKRFIDQTTLFSSKLNKQVDINFTGGEVTEWDDFSDLLAYCKNQNCRVRFITNAMTSMSILTEVFKNSDAIIIEVHPEFSSTSHILFVVQSALKSNLQILVNINMLPEYWGEMQDLYDKISQRHPTVSLNKKIVFEDPVFNTTPQNYTEEQIVALKTQTGDIKIEQDHDIVYTNFQTMILEQTNRFQGYQCWAGVEQIIVDAWGRVYRGHCRKNGFMGYLKDLELFWYDSPMLCGVAACANHFDIQATKQSSE